MKRLIDILWALVHPGYWIMLGEYSEIWDTQLNKLLKENKFSNLDTYYATLGNKKLWIANHPYGSFTCNTCIRPSRRTIAKAFKKMIEDCLK